MRFRKLRIAWSVGWGIACVLLIALWVRRYWSCDIVYYNPDPYNMYRVRSDEGEISYQNCEWTYHTWGNQPGSGWTLRRMWKDELTDAPGASLLRNIFRGFEYDGRFGYRSPDWFLVLLAAMAAVAPWIHWSGRFSLRALLIATTLVALVLGLAVYVPRK